MLPALAISARALRSLRRLALLLLLLGGCANPVPPGGGPRDQQPPRIATSRPEVEATNVAGQTVSIQFNEYVERASLREALTVTPAPPGRLEFDWDQQGVEIRFPEPFRDSTTYLLTIDKAFEDVRGVALEQPITLAFSTGDQIDRGRLSGRVIGNARGEGREGFDVYAYAAAASENDTLPDAPLYRTQTGPDGTFQFSYLRTEDRYYVVALRDRNRNYRADPLEPFAAPQQPALVARDTATAGDTFATRDAAPWMTGREDPVPPRLTRALPLSRRRLALRFSEPVRLQSRRPGHFALTDTVTGQSVAVRSVYRRPGERQRLTLRTAPMRPAGHRVRLVPGDSVGAMPVVTDTSGNAPERPAEAAFAAPERADTLGLRFRGFTKKGPALPVPGEGNALTLAPGQVAAVQFNQPPSGGASQRDTTAARRLLSARDTTSGEPFPFRLATDDGTTYRVAFEPPLAAGQVARLRVEGARLRPPADTVYTRLVRRLSNEALGAVIGAVQIARDTAASDTALVDTVATSRAGGPPVVVELYAAGNVAEDAGGGPLRTTRADSSGTFAFRRLPEAAYRFRAFLDRDTDGQWDAGRLAPYRPAEPLAWSRRPVEARPRWETATEDTLRIDGYRFSIDD